MNNRELFAYAQGSFICKDIFEKQLLARLLDGDSIDEDFKLMRLGDASDFYIILQELYALPITQEITKRMAEQNVWKFERTDITNIAALGTYLLHQMPPNDDTLADFMTTFCLSSWEQSVKYIALEGLLKIGTEFTKFHFGDSVFFYISTDLDDPSLPINYFFEEEFLARDLLSKVLRNCTDIDVLDPVEMLEYIMRVLV